MPRGRKKKYDMRVYLSERQLKKLMKKKQGVVTISGKKLRVYYYGRNLVRNGVAHAREQVKPWWRFW